MDTQFRTYRTFLSQQYTNMCFNQELSYVLQKANKLFTIAYNNIGILKSNPEYDLELSKLINSNASNLSEREIEKLIERVEEYLKGLEVKNTLLTPKIEEVEEKLDGESYKPLISKGLMLIEEFGKPLNFAETSLLEIEVKHYLLLFPQVKETNLFFKNHKDCSSQLKNNFNSLCDQIVKNPLDEKETNHILNQSKILLEDAKEDIMSRNTIALDFRDLDKFIEKHPRFLKTYGGNIEKLKTEIRTIKVFTTRIAEKIAEEIDAHKRKFQQTEKERREKNFYSGFTLIIGLVIAFYVYLLINYIMRGDIFAIIALVVIGWVVRKGYQLIAGS